MKRGAGRPAARDGALLALAAVVAFAWTIVVRVTGPDDLWDQTQPATAAYGRRWWPTARR